MPLATPLLSDHVHEEVEDVESTGGAKTAFGSLLLMTLVVVEIIKFIQEDGMNMPAQGMNSDSSMVSVIMSVSHNETFQLVASPRTTDTRIPDMIMDPDEMYSEGGMVSPPVWIMTIRAFLIFGAQQACLFVDRGAPLEWDTVVDFFDRSGRLGKLSIIFQIIGQGIVVFSWTAVFRVVQPMEGNQRLEAFALLVSQHIASVIVVVGLTNNLFMSFYAGSQEECFIARWLSCTGFLVGLPLWISLASVGFPYNIESIIIVLVCSALAVLVAVAINRCMQRKIAWRAMAANSLRGLVNMLNQAEEAEKTRKADEDAATAATATATTIATATVAMSVDDGSCDNLLTTAEEDARLKAEEEKKKAYEAARSKAQEEERRRKADEDAKSKVKEEQKKADAAARLKDEEEEKKRKADEDAESTVEENKKAGGAARLKAEQEERKQKADEDARLNAEEEQKADEAARSKAEEEERKRQADEDAATTATATTTTIATATVATATIAMSIDDGSCNNSLTAPEDDARLKSEEENKNADEAARSKAEEEERRRKADDDAKVEESKKADASARLKVEEEDRRRKADEDARIKAGKEQTMADEAARSKAEEEERRSKTDEAARLKAVEEERNTKVDEAARVKAELEKKKVGDSARVKAEEKKKKADEAARSKDEEEEKKRKADEAARSKAEEEEKKKEGQMTASETMRKKMVVRRDLIEGSTSLVSQPQTPRASGKCKPGPTEETPSANEKFQKAPKEAASPKKEAAKRDATPKEEHHHHHHSEGRHHHHHGDHHHHKDSHHTDSIAASPPASARHHHHHHHGQSRHGHSDQDFQCTAKLDFEQTSRASPAPRCLQEDAQHKASPPPGAKDPRAVAAATRHYRRHWHSAVWHLRNRHWHFRRGHTHRNWLVKHGTSDADTESQANPTFAEICEKVQEYGGQVFQAIYEDVNQKFYLHLKLILIFGPFGLSLWWLYMGASTQPLYSFMNFSGLFSALILPLLAIVSCRESPFSKDGVCYAMLMAFSTGLTFIYLYCMIIPTAILTAHGHTADAAALAFWGKKLQAYLTYTFKFPTATAATTTGDLATQHWRVVAVWGSEFLGLPPILLIISVTVRLLCEVGPRRHRLMGALTYLKEQAFDRLRGIWIRLAIGPSLETYFAHHQDRAHLALMQQIISNRIHELDDTSLAGLQP